MKISSNKTNKLCKGTLFVLGNFLSTLGITIKYLATI